MSNAIDIGTEIIFEFVGIPNLNEPEVAEKWARGRKLVHYTTTKAAISILDNKELLLTSARRTNDKKEILYGAERFSTAVTSGWAQQFTSEAAEIIGTDKVNSIMEQKISVDYLRGETYLSCLSEHRKMEEDRGRLSMWRAYGDTAIVLKAEKMVSLLNMNQVLMIPVQYDTSDENMKNRFALTKEMFQDKKDHLRELAVVQVESILQAMKVLFTVSVKHPGFDEENEIRLVGMMLPTTIERKRQGIKALKGVPQRVWRFALTHYSTEKKECSTMDDVLDKILIGPSNDKEAKRETFVEKLKELKVNNPKRKVLVSDIPLST